MKNLLYNHFLPVAAIIIVVVIIITSSNGGGAWQLIKKNNIQQPAFWMAGFFLGLPQPLQRRGLRVLKSKNFYQPVTLHIVIYKQKNGFLL